MVNDGESVQTEPIFQGFETFSNLADVLNMQENNAD